ncbi:hypothetical protein PsorP6_010790 [Peronosclerospora sorghi]|uniref:Uncharacterized protein n=1 Tax=Peronosclerospora sorghi TaxID=230839 RepID=A0ACC0VV55_9STRA|nr:hypothetical protein PsorP6_010790 [Peronosclerospora sorghi]
MASPSPIQLTLVEARDILAVNSSGTSSPYVTVTLLDSKDSPIAAGGSFKTKAIKKTLAPVWHETFLIGDKLDLRVATTLRLLLCDSDSAFYSDEVLGVVDIPVSLLLTLETPLENWFQLMKHSKMKKDATGELHVLLERCESKEREGLVDAQASGTMDQAPNLLIVTLESGKDLLGMDNNGTSSDPIVFLSFNGQQHTSTKKDKTLKPQWHEKFRFFATDLKPKLTLLVEDVDLTVNDFMGKAHVSLKHVQPHEEQKLVVSLGNGRGKQDKIPRGTLTISVLWTFAPDARTLAAKKKKTSLFPSFGVPDQDYDSNDDDDGIELDERRKTNDERRKEEEEKAVQQAALMTELSSFAIASGDYSVQVHVIEARDLVPKDATGTSDPVVYVDVLGETQQTGVKKQVLRCFWDEVLIFSFRNLDKAQVEMGSIHLRVMDANTLLRAELIGATHFDLSYIYAQANHQLANVWLGLTDLTHTSNQGIQGYLRVSISIIGPGDKLVPPPSPFTLTDLTPPDVFIPSNVTQQVHFLGVTIHVAEHLPPMDVAVVGRGGLDAYVKGSIAGGEAIRTRVRTQKGRRDELCPRFNEELLLVIREPSMADSIQLGVFDWDQVGADELVAYVYESVKLVKKMDGRMGPSWANLYGAPLRLKTVGREETPARQMNLYPELASTYRGRLLLSFRILTNDDQALDEVNQKRNVKRLPRDLYPRERIYRMRAHFVWGNEIPSFLSTHRPGHKASMQLVLSCGLNELASSRQRNVNGVVEWNDMDESEKMLLPEDLSQVPDVFLYLCKGEGEARRAVCFRRFRAHELMVERGGFDTSVEWFSLQADQALHALEDETFPGNVLVRLGFGTEEMAMETAWDRRDLSIVNQRVPYQLRVHLYQGRELPPADANGLLDPFVVVKCVGEQSKMTSKKRKTRDPVWYETLYFDVHLPKLAYAPQVLLRVMDYDDFDTNDFVGLAALNLSDAFVRTSEDVSGGTGPPLPDPTWHALMFQAPGDSEGELLASLELVRKRFPDETVPRSLPIRPLNRRAYLEITVLGLRKLEPYQFVPIQLPFVEFVLGGKDHAAQEMLTDKSKRPSGSNPNFLARIVKPVDLPENALFAPRLNIIVKDTRLGGFQTPIIGSASIDMSRKIPWSKTYRAPQTEHIAEVELESSDEPANEWDALLGKSAVDTGAGVFGALQSLGVALEGSEDASSTASCEDDLARKKYMKHREVLDHELEQMLETTPFETYGLHRGQKKQTSWTGGLNPFGRKKKASGQDRFKRVGWFKGLIRVLEHEDEKPLFEWDTLLQKLPYEVRVYVLDGVGFAPMDLGWNGRPGKSDPYLRLTLGNETISDRENYIPDTTEPDFYKLFRLHATLPGASILTIEALDHDLIGGDDLIGKTTIDLEDRVFDRRWQSLGQAFETARRFRLKPVETRTLTIPTSRAPMGSVKLWIDILSPGQAHAYPALDISLPPPVEMELRVVIWRARDVPSFDTLEDMNDLFFRCWMEGGAWQETDVHWRAKKGKGSFNWRFKFPVVLGHKQVNTKMPYFHVQAWDKDILSANDAIGEHTVDLGLAFRRAAHGPTQRVQVFPDDDETRKRKNKAVNDEDAAVKKIREATGLWDDEDPPDSKWLKLDALDHKTQTRQMMGEVCVSMELVPVEEAVKHPVGSGRSAPNNSPYLPPPPGRLTFSLNPFKVLNDLLGPAICNRLMCCSCCLLFMVLVYFFAPFINVAIIALKK